MMLLLTRAFVFLAFSLVLSLAARAQSFTSKPGEAAHAFALRAAGASGDPQADPDAAPPGIVAATWNGRSFVFVDYGVIGKIPGGSDTEQDRPLVALEKMPDGGYRRIAVTTGEEEGGPATVEAIAFARASHDPADDLIVLLSWPVQHADVSGTLYEVRIFADPGTGAALTYLKDVSQHFNESSCDCDRGDGKPEHYRFKTMAAIRKELKALGY